MWFYCYFCYLRDVSKKSSRIFFSLGPIKHFDILFSMHNLAFILKSQNNNEKAKSFLKECFKFRKDLNTVQREYSINLEAATELAQNRQLFRKKKAKMQKCKKTTSKTPSPIKTSYLSQIRILRSAAPATQIPIGATNAKTQQQIPQLQQQQTRAKVRTIQNTKNSTLENRTVNAKPKITPLFDQLGHERRRQSLQQITTGHHHSRNQNSISTVGPSVPQRRFFFFFFFFF